MCALHRYAGKTDILVPRIVTAVRFSPLGPRPPARPLESRARAHLFARPMDRRAGPGRATDATDTVRSASARPRQLGAPAAPPAHHTAMPASARRAASTIAARSFSPSRPLARHSVATRSTVSTNRA